MKGLSIVAVSCLLLGCGDSLFDSNSGSNTDAGVGDRSDANNSDAAPSDAAPVVTTCPEPCEGDAVADFDMSQGGSNDRWFYLQDTRSPDGLAYPELEIGSVAGAPAWVSADSPAAIVNCAQNPTASVCEGTANHLVFIPSTSGGADRDPVLAYRAPSNGTYVISGQARSPDGAGTNLSQRILLIRNARHDLLHSKTFVTSTSDETFSVTVTALAGDQIALTVLPNASGTPEPLAVQLFVTLVADKADAFPGACQFAATFDTTSEVPSPFVDRCRGATIENLNDGVGPAGESVDIAAAGAQYDRARQLSEGQYLRSQGLPADYSGDFTVQFWAKLDASQPAGFSDAYADWNDDGGVNIAFRSGSGLMEASYAWTDPAMPLRSGVLSGTAPSDGAWHFYRLSRNASGISFCIDSIQQGSDPAPGTFNMTSGRKPHIGRNVNYNPAYFGGGIDDVRVISRALPCLPGQ